MANDNMHNLRKRSKVEPQSDPKPQSLSGLDKLLNKLKTQKIAPDPTTPIYLELVSKLSTTYTNIKPSLILDHINQIMTPRKDWTKGEKSVMYCGKIMALGALIRSRPLSTFEIELINAIIKEIIVLAQRKHTFLTIGTPFICYILNDLGPAQLKELDLTQIQPLLSKEFKNDGDGLVFRISLICKRKELSIEYPKLDDVSAKVQLVIRGVKHDDNETIKELFLHLKENKELKEWWNLFSESMSPKHFNLLCSCIRGTVDQSGENITHVFIQKIISSILDVFRWSESEPIKQAKNVMRLLLSNWNKNGPQKRKHRKEIIKKCFGELDLLAHYKQLHSVLREFLMHLTADELDYVKSLTEKSITENKVGSRNAAVTFLGRIGSVKTTKVETKVEIGIQLIKLAYCVDPNKMETEDEDGQPGSTAESSDSESTLITITQNAFTSLLKTVYNTKFVDSIYKYVESLAKREAPEVLLKKPLVAQHIEYFEDINKINSKLRDPEVAYILKVYAVYLLVDPEFASEALIRLWTIFTVLSRRNKPPTRVEILEKLLTFIIGSIQVEKVIYNYEMMFNHFLMDESVQPNSVERLIEAINSTDKVLGLEDGVSYEDDNGDDSKLERDAKKNGTEDEESDDDDGEGDDDANIEELEGFDKEFSQDSNRNMSDSDEESLDMDTVGEDQLNAFDAALSSVFSLKKKMKQEKEMEKVFLMRLFQLLENVMKRYKRPAASIPLHLIRLCVKKINQTSKSPKGAEIRSRIFALLRRINNVKDTMDPADDEVWEKEFLGNVVKEVGRVLSRKLDKITRTLLADCVRMTYRCYVFENLLHFQRLQDEELDAIYDTYVKDRPKVKSYSEVVKESRKRKHQE